MLNPDAHVSHSCYVVKLHAFGLVRQSCFLSPPTEKYTEFFTFSDNTNLHYSLGMLQSLVGTSKTIHAYKNFKIAAVHSYTYFFSTLSRILFLT